MNYKPKKRILVAALAACLAGLVLWPHYMMVWEIAALAFLAAAGGHGTRWVGLLGVAISAIGAVLYGFEIFPFVLDAVLPGVVMGIMISREDSLGKALTGGYLAGIAGFFLSWAWLEWYVGIPLGMSGIEKGFASYVAASLEYFKLPEIQEAYDALGMSVELVKQAFTAFTAALQGIRPALFIQEAWVKILAGLLLARLFLLGRGYLRAPRFSEQRMAWQLDWVIIAALSLWLTGAQWGPVALKAIGSDILVLMIPVLFYFGLSLTVFLFKKWKVRRWVLVIMLMGTMFWPFQATLLISILGLFDPLFDYRDMNGERGSPV